MENIATRRNTHTEYQGDAIHCALGIVVTDVDLVVKSIVPPTLRPALGAIMEGRSSIRDVLGDEAYRVVEAKSLAFSRPCSCEVSVTGDGHEGQPLSLHVSQMRFEGKDYRVFILDPSATYLTLIGELIEVLSAEHDRASIISKSLMLFIRHDAFSYASCFIREGDSSRLSHLSTVGRIATEDITSQRSIDEPAIAEMSEAMQARIAEDATYLEERGRAYGISAPLIILVPLASGGTFEGFLELVTSADVPPLCDQEVLTRCGSLISCALHKVDAYFAELGTYSLISNVLDSSHHYFIVVDSEERTQFVNNAFARYTGQTSKTIPSLARWYKFLDDDSYRRMKQLVATVLSQGEPLIGTFPLYTPWGDHSHVEWRVLPLTGEGGIIRGAVCIGGDVTTEVDNEQRISLLYSLVGELIQLGDEEQIVQRAGTIIEQIIDYDTFMLTINDTANGVTVVKYGGGDTEQGYAYPIEKGTGIISHVAATGKRYVMERRQGDPLYIQGSAEMPAESEIAVPVRSHGVTYGVLNFELIEQHVFGDIEIRLIETMADILAIALSNARLVASLEQERKIVSNLLNAANNYIVIFDTDLSVRSINAQLAELSGFSQDDEITWEDFTRIVPRDDYNRVTERLRWVLEHGTLDRNINVLTDAQKGPVIISWYNSPIKDEEGNVNGIISIGQDITQRIKLELRLVESNLFTSSVIENVEVGIAVIDESGIVQQANPAYLHWIERPAGEVIGERIEETFPYSTLDLRDTYERVAATKNRRNVELVARIGDSKKVASVTFVPFELPPLDSVISYPFQTDAVVIDHMHEESTGSQVLIVVHDITKRAEAERRMTRAHRRLERIISSAGTLILGYDTSGTITLFNATAERVTGYAADEVIGSKVWDVLAPPRDQDQFREMIASVLSASVPQTAELHITTKGGDRRLIRWERTYTYNDSGLIEEVISIGLDVTEERRIEDRLRQSEGRFRGLFENALIGFILLEPQERDDGSYDFIIRDINPAAMRICSVSKEEVAGRSFEHCLPCLRKIEAFDAFSRAATREESTELPSFQCDSLGKETVVQVNVFEAAKNVVVSLKDITEQRRSERQMEAQSRALEEKSDELERFIYRTSHDLKSPLTSLRGMVNLFKEDYGVTFDEDAQYYLERIEANTSRMERLITSLLKLSRIGQSSEPPEAVPVAEAVREAVHRCRREHGDDNVIEVAEGLPTVTYVRSQLVEVFEQLIDNALTYVDDDTTPHVRIGHTLDGERHMFSVSDNGVGIAPEYTEKIFKVFERLHGKDIPGSGIGLSLAQRIVESHGGSIWVESEKGTGSTFHFSIPVMEDDNRGI